jgi:aspartate kinase
MLDEEFSEIVDQIKQGASADYAASRGEYLSAKLVAKVLSCQFVDAAKIIFFPTAANVEVDSGTLAAYAASGTVVVPGFYGMCPDMSIRTFSRGGSDVTGALLAQALRASVYENWTDVSGMLMADPRVVENPKTIETLSYKELRELAYMGANVFHEEAMFPVAAAGVPTNIRNTNDPEHPGTLIVPESSQELAPNMITGIAGRRGFAVLKVEKAMMNQEVGFVRKLLTVFEDKRISFEHAPSGIDSVSVILEQSLIDKELTSVIENVSYSCRPDFIGLERSLALVAIVGRRMADTPGVAAKVCTAVAEAGVNLRMIIQGSSEINIIIGVKEADFETAIQAIYATFVVP